MSTHRQRRLEKLRQRKLNQRNGKAHSPPKSSDLVSTETFWKGYEVISVKPKLVELFGLGQRADGAGSFVLWAITNDKRVIELRLPRALFARLLGVEVQA